MENFKHAIVYGKSVKHQPQRVGLSHELGDEDISRDLSNSHGEFQCLLFTSYHHQALIGQTRSHTMSHESYRSRCYQNPFSIQATRRGVVKCDVLEDVSLISHGDRAHGKSHAGGNYGVLPRHG